ncbi:MAG: hypothetical protein DHS20C15_21950 [Planctomycetota bacterium]|nr:MAG: hypothetical protein DHS20C15_21950 [Planctomycetota bacterium]
MARKKAEIEDVPLDLTPMIDVVFLLLIFFIVTIKFKVLEGKLVTELPKDEGSNAGDVTLIDKIEIDIVPQPSAPDGFITQVNGQTMPNMATLRDTVARFVAAAPEGESARGTIHPRTEVNYEQVVMVVDQLLQVDLTDITFAGVDWDV